MPESTRKKRILYLITSSAWGGAERYVARLVEASEAEFEPLVMSGSSEGQELFKALPLGVRTAVLPELKSVISPAKDRQAIKKLIRFIDAEGIDLVHCNSSKAGMVGTLAAARSKRKPKVVYTAHGWGFLERRNPLFRALVLWAEKLAAHYRDATIVLSKKEYEVALQHRLGTDKNLHLIPHGIDAGELSFIDRTAARAELSRKAGVDLQQARIVGTIANAYPAKALPLLIEAFSTLKATPALHLVIIGDGPSMEEVRAVRKASPAKARISLLGAIPEASRLMKGFDLFVLSSVKEGLPWVIFEASLAGVPIIATDVGGIPELIHPDIEGLLIPPGDAKALTSAMTKALTDDALRTRLAHGATLIAERHSGTAMTQATVRLYHQLLP